MMFFKQIVYKGLLIAGLGIGMLATIVCELPIFPDNYEPNDTYDEASAISLGTIKATINPEDDEDYYRVNLEGEADIVLIYELTMPPALQPQIYLYDAPDNTLDYKRADKPGQAIHDSLTVSPGEIVIRVRSANYESSGTEYSLTLTTSAPVAAGK